MSSSLHKLPIGVDRDSEVLAITGLISGSGKGLTKAGSGELLLTQNNTFNGRNSAVEAGKLTVNGLQPNTNIIVSGGVLQGTGTFGGVTVKIGGAIDAGDDGIGTLTINGNFTSQGQLRVQVSPSFGDLLKVNGTVNISNSPIIVTGNTTLKSYVVIQNDLTDAVQGSTNATVLTSESGE